jgi:hypothetical protein
MATGKEFNATDYIQHHLTFLTKGAQDGGFWAINVDSVATAGIMGAVVLGLLWWIVAGRDLGRAEPAPGVRGSGVRVRRRSVRGIFHHGDRSRFVAPAALTVFRLGAGDECDGFPARGHRPAGSSKRCFTCTPSGSCRRRREYHLRARAFGVGC